MGTRSFIGVLYSKVIPGKAPESNVITAKEYYFDDAKNIHLKKEVSLYESDVDLGKLPGMPLYVNHEYMHGPVGTIRDAWFSTDKTLGDKYYNYGLHHGQERNQEGLRLVIRGEVEEEKIPFIYKAIDVDSLENASLSVGYRYKCKACKWNNAGVPVEYDIGDKQIFEGSLCKHGRIANSGVLMLCRADSPDLNDKSQIIHVYQNSDVKLLTLENNGKKIANKNKKDNDRRRMESNNASNATGSPNQRTTTEEVSKNSARHATDENADSGSVPSKQRGGIQLESYYPILQKHAEQLGLNPNDPDVGAKLIVCMLEDREERIYQYSRRTEKTADDAIGLIKNMSEEYPVYSLSSVECNHVKNVLSDPKNELVFRCFALFTEKQKAMEKQLTLLQNARKEAKVRARHDIPRGEESEGSKRAALHARDGMEIDDGHLNNGAMSSAPPAPARKSLFNLSGSLKKEALSCGVMQNSFLSSGISDANQMSSMIKQLTDEIHRGVQGSGRSKVRDSRFNDVDLH